MAGSSSSSSECPRLQVLATDSSAHVGHDVITTAPAFAQSEPRVDVPVVSIAEVVSSTDGVEVNTVPCSAHPTRNLSLYSGGCENGEPELLLVGDYIIRFAEIPNRITYCLSGAKIVKHCGTHPYSHWSPPDCPYYHCACWYKRH